MIPFLIDDLKRDEGFRAVAYPDPLSGGEPFTCGYGCTGPDITARTVWTPEQADEELAKRVQQLEAQLDHSLPWWRTLDPVRQAVVGNMAYNLGLGGLLAFHHFLAALQAGDYHTAAAEMMASHWATQVKPRAQRLAKEMLTGVRQS